MNEKRSRSLGWLGILISVSALCSVAATNFHERRNSGIEGKWVDVIGQSGSDGEISNRVSIHELGRRDFLVKRQKLDGSDTEVDVWIPLENIRSIVVYDSKEDALKHTENNYGFVADYSPASSAE